ncbi:MAG TPA: hypothetical protein VK783_06625 [Bacteroidia bacterium]|jgi:hypothetical protein|nr:hypothetical protein [Bacteroidia bacterium]
MDTVKSPMKIEKEEIAKLHFPESEVLTTADDLTRRKYELERASQLGNGDHVKIKIVFEDTESIKQVETTVWAVTGERVVLKHGITIPIKRIHEIK